MEIKIMSFQERLERIVDQSYVLLCQQIVMGKFRVYNEASLQMQFAVILNSIGQLYEFERKDQFEIELEENVNLKSKTSKSTKGKARCDIWLRLSRNGCKLAECAIELKCFLQQGESETSTDNRKAILQDIENLENYSGTNKKFTCYEVVYTTNPKYSDNKSISYLNIGNGQTLQGKITHPKTGQIIANLSNSYTFNWDEYDNKGKHCFLKLKVDSK